MSEDVSDPGTASLSPAGVRDGSADGASPAVWMSAAGLVSAALLAYAGSFTVPFELDDFRWIVESPSLGDWAAVWASLSLDNRPLVMLSLGVNYALGGLDVRGYHAFNLAVHAAAGWLLFGIVRRVLGRVNRRSRQPLPALSLAFSVALIWLIHPLQTQSVTYVIQRCESLMGMFFFLCLYGVVRASEARRAWPWHLVAVAACILGLGCKEVMVAAPVVALLLDRALLASSWAELFRRRGVLHALLFAAAAALLAAMTSRTRGYASAGFGCVVAEHLRRAVELKPDYLHALVNYGNLLVRQNQFKEAVVYYDRALRLAPTNAVIHLNLGTALLKSGLPQDSVSAYRRALHEDPKLAGAKLQLAWVLATARDDDLRDGTEAVRLAEEIRSDFGEHHARLLDVLAAAYAEVGRFDEACEAASKALTAAVSSGLAEYEQSLGARLLLYRHSKPYREEGSPDTPAAVSEVPEDAS